VVVPIHWGEPHGTREEVEAMRDRLHAELRILEREA
jgi:hypothetical protein